MFGTSVQEMGTVRTSLVSKYFFKLWHQSNADQTFSVLYMQRMRHINLHGIKVGESCQVYALPWNADLCVWCTCMLTLMLGALIWWITHIGHAVIVNHTYRDLKTDSADLRFITKQITRTSESVWVTTYMYWLWGSDIVVQPRWPYIIVSHIQQKLRQSAGITIA